MGYVHESIDWLHTHWFVPGKTLNPGNDQPDLSSLPPLGPK